MEKVIVLFILVNGGKYRVVESMGLGLEVQPPYVETVQAHYLDNICYNVSNDILYQFGRG